MENSAFNLFASHYAVFGRNSIDDLSIQLYPEVDFYNDWWRELISEYINILDRRNLPIIHYLVMRLWSEKTHV